MIELPPKLERAIEAFSRLPGVGGKTATRQIFNIMNWSNEERLAYSEAIAALNDLNACSECGLYAEETICNICSNETRKEAATLCVVESISDLLAIEKSQVFKGVYHVLNGVLNPLLGVGPDQLRMDGLKERCLRDNIQTVILALSPSVEGDATCSYIKNELGESIHVERIGFGIPMGGSLEYLDPLTISKALENRKELL